MTISPSLAYYYRHHEKILARNREVRPAYMKEYRAKRRQWFDELKSSLICESCGVTNEEANGLGLFFHHRDPSTKLFNVGHEVLHRSRSSIVAEMEKCVVLCHGCHTTLHDEGRIRDELGRYV
jgi:protein-arginine kinase activator protein McsA